MNPTMEMIAGIVQPHNDKIVAEAKLETALAEIAKLRAALDRIVKLDCEPFTFPSDWREQIAACPECKRYEDHPIQQGICDLHRKPLYARERHEDHQQRTLIYKAQNIARAALQ